MHTIGTPPLWLGFTALVLCLLAIDLGVVNRRAHSLSMREASMWTVLWIGIAAASGGLVYWHFGRQPALEFVTCYLIEEALSVDNLFVFLVLFQFFRVDSASQHRVLFWGILGAMVFRAVFVFAGTALVTRFQPVMYAFGAILIYTAIKLVTGEEEDALPTERRVYKLAVRLIGKILPVTPTTRGAAIFVRENGKLLATPLLIVLVAIETTDIVFAIDSVPAAFGVTRDPFIIYTSNIFAILGLRALYFVLAGFMERFRYLNYGLALVLAFVGAKMIIEPWVHISIGLSLAVIASAITASAVLSVIVTRRRDGGGKRASQDATRAADQRRSHHDERHPSWHG